MLEYGISLTGENESVKTCILAYFMQCVCWSFFHKVNFFVTLFFCCLFFFLETWKFCAAANFTILSLFTVSVYFLFFSRPLHRNWVPVCSLWLPYNQPCVTNNFMFQKECELTYNVSHISVAYL